MLHQMIPPHLGICPSMDNGCRTLPAPPAPGPPRTPGSPAPISSKHASRLNLIPVNRPSA